MLTYGQRYSLLNLRTISCTDAVTSWTALPSQPLHRPRNSPHVIKQPELSDFYNSGFVQIEQMRNNVLIVEI